MKNYQWFEPGDKVMRVGYEKTLADNDLVKYLEDDNGSTPLGRLFYVHQCYIDPLDSQPTMQLVGCSCEFLTHNFRKVEEIQLCVKAAEAFKNPILCPNTNA